MPPETSLLTLQRQQNKPPETPTVPGLGTPQSEPVWERGRRRWKPPGPLPNETRTPATEVQSPSTVGFHTAVVKETEIHVWPGRRALSSVAGLPIQRQ